MSLKVDWLVIDAADPGALAVFWEQALTNYEILREDDDDDDEEEFLLVPVDRLGPKILIGKTTDHKAGKNRLHLDLRPQVGGDKDAEVARLEALGATRVDIGQGDVTWTVMADPEGNEFCILRVLSSEEAEKFAAWAW